ncbi:ABC transporter permease [Mucilaginibacter sp. RS28]|uniref:ABC transporter permease n=1 Tax=Mucilaginibacter straminoryzae TaxID=2932774 RepID=A0A9X1X4X9_9SPHI|nr:ABC transporter permease [Mucilaginibacter straminoryzae]MCJ8211252.1 ABC transporter permease [Mucilaginibacter straminoryzae]
MLINYLKIAIRSFRRNLVVSVINVTGLAIGISAALVIYLIVHHDFSYENFRKDKDRIYRIVSIMHFPNQDFKNSGVPFPLQKAARTELSGAEQVAPVTVMYPMKVSIPLAGNNFKKFKKQPDVVYTDDSFFRLFETKWLAGSLSSLTQPFNVVLTESRAKAYFDIKAPQEAIGRVVVYNDSIKTTVSGIVADPPVNTDFNFKDFISLSTGDNADTQFKNWNVWNNIDSQNQLFFKASPATTTASLEKQLKELHDKNLKNDFLKSQYLLQPLSDIHFNADYQVFDHRIANKRTLYGLLVVAGILLLLACINFVNLTTAHAVNRAREIGIRKTLGSSYRQLIVQFLSETLVITATAALLSYLFVPILLKIFADFIPPDVHFSPLQQPNLIAFTIILIVVVGLFAGLYPAFVLARFNAVTSLKKQVSTNGKGNGKSALRQTLTIFQFTVAQVFIVATLIVSKQIHFVLNKDLGFKKDGIVAIDLPGDQPVEKQQVLLQAVKSLPQVEQAVLGGQPPARNGFATTVIQYRSGKKLVNNSTEIKYADENYFKMYGLKLVAGKYLSPSDSIRGIMINESYLHLLGFKQPDEALGARLKIQNRTVPVVGVLRDFYFSSLHNAIKPLAYSASTKGEYFTLHVKLKPNSGDSWHTALSSIESRWHNIYGDKDFDYQFVDESIAGFYKAEQNISQLLNWATGLSIFISCMGLLGLVMHSTLQRTKEIGIRKVLGASVAGIVALLSVDFLKLILIAIVLASPLAWLATSQWLQGFAYRATVPWWLFVLSGVLAIGVAFVTISFNAVKAALTNPVKSLRSE